MHCCRTTPQCQGQALSPSLAHPRAVSPVCTPCLPPLACRSLLGFYVRFYLAGMFYEEVH